MTSNTTTISSAALKERIVEVEREIANIEKKMTQARRAAARAYLSGQATDEVSSLRTQARNLKDVLLGLRDCAQEAELSELDLEIDQREKACAKEAERVEQLRTISSRGAAVLEGTGNFLAIAQRRDQEDRRADFATYERAYISLIEERKVLEALKQRLCELKGELYHAPAPTFVGV